MALSTKFMVQQIYSQSDTNRILLQDGDTIIVDVTDEYDKILGLRQEARAHVLRELEVAD